jgi:hypothetical protein
MFALSSLSVASDE